MRSKLMTVVIGLSLATAASGPAKASGLARSLKNGGFESPTDPSSDSDNLPIAGWPARSKACVFNPGAGATARTTSKKPYPLVGEGKQYAMLILRKTHVLETWVYQSLGVVSSGDVGKAYILTVELGSRYQNAEKFALAEVAFRTNVDKKGLGEALGDVGQLALMNGNRLVPVRAVFVPTPADVGKNVSAVISLRGLSVRSGSDQYFADDAKLTVVATDALDAALARLPAAPDPLLLLMPLWETKHITPKNMMKEYLFGQLDAAYAKWRADYEQRKTPDQISGYQKRLKLRFVEAVGGFPERTPLNPQIVATVEQNGYRVEKILFESQPRHYVTAAIFLPDPGKYKPPYPGILVPCGHSSNGKAYEAYQKACALAAINGLAAMIFDPIDQGERHQLLDANGKARLASCAGHNMVGVSSILLGRNTARFEIWDGMRGIDYLQSRPDIDAKRIGCMGNSGGGTQTSYFMALDDRIVAAAPSCYVCSLFGRLLRTYGAQDAEQNIFGQLVFGMDHPDYCMMRAPKPTLLCTATKDFFNIEDAWATLRYAKRLYARLGFAERMDLVETDEPHGFSIRLREGAVRWMLRWLAHRDEHIREPADLKILSDQQIQCTPRGEVMLIEGARSVYDLNRDYEVQLAKRRKDLWSKGPRAELLERVRDLAGIRKSSELPGLTVERLGTEKRDGYGIQKLLLKPEEGIWLPALLFVPDSSEPTGLVLYVHERGKYADAKPGGPIEALAKRGRAVLAVDLRGTGETQQVGQRYFNLDCHGSDGQDFYTAYLLGRTYVGMRAEDVIVCAKWLVSQAPTGKLASVHLVGVGHMGIPALHAAAAEPALFASVKLVRTLTSWSNVVRLGFAKTPYVSLVHGALTTYDLADLAGTLGQKLAIQEPLDGMRRPCSTSR